MEIYGFHFLNVTKLSRKLATLIFFCIANSAMAQSPSTTQIDSLYNLGFELRNGPLDSAFAFIDQSRKLSKSIGYPFGEVKAEIFSIFFFARKGRLDTARVIEEKVMKRLESSPDLRGTFQEALAFYYAGIVKLRGQELAQAKVYYSNALKIFTKLNNDYFIGSTYSRLGIIELNLSNYSEALELFVRSYEIKVAANRPPSEYAPELANISNVYWRMGLKEDAFEYARRSLNLEIERGNDLNVARSLMNIGSLHVEDNTDSAIFYYNEAYATASTHGFIKTAALAKYNLALQLRTLGRLNESTMEMEDLIEKVKVHNYMSINANIYGLLAENYLYQGNTDKAIAYAQISLKISKDGASKRNIYRAARILGMAHEKALNSDSVLFYTRMYHSYKDSVFSRENQAKITSLNSRLDNLEIQKEIEVLEKQKQLDKTSKMLLIISLVALGLISALIVMLLILRQKGKQRKQRLKDLEMEKEMRGKEQELQQQTLHMINMNHGIAEVENQLQEMKAKPVISGNDVQKVLSNIKINKTIEKEWENFNNYFGKMHRDFYETLAERHPDLSIQNKRLAALIKIDLSNREIGQILNITHSSVKMGRYRLKSKIGLNENQKLAEYLKGI